MRLFRYRHWPVVEHVTGWFTLPPQSWDAIVNRDDVHDWLTAAIAGQAPLPGPPDPADRLAPIGSQEVWAAGVTYFRSRTARMEESQVGAAAAISTTASTTPSARSCSSRPRRTACVGPGRSPSASAATRAGTCRSRSWRWLSTPRGRIVGYTIGNDMSSRDIEGENPLYLPQAKVYDGSCGAGPRHAAVTTGPLPPDTEIRARDPACGRARVRRNDVARRDEADAAQELVDCLFRDNSLPAAAAYC